MNKLPTISLKGREYVQVKDRIVYFNETYPNGQIRTKIVSSLESGAKMVRFRAEVQPDVSMPRKFTAHSFGTIDEVKAFEKLETVAVGRALALMGIGVLESVASADEMERFNQKSVAPLKQTQNILPCTDYVFDSILSTGEFSLGSGISKKTGKPFYTVAHKDQKYFITESQHSQLQK